MLNGMVALIRFEYLLAPNSTYRGALQVSITTGEVIRLARSLPDASAG
jgi:hypothetical protein